MKVLQINTEVNTGSTGRIAEEIGRTFVKEGHESYIAGSKIGTNGSRSKIIKIGNKLDTYWHGLKTRFADRHGFGSKRVTRELVRKVKEIDPDVIGLHNLHGYYLNIKILFKYLKQLQKPVVWTFHDCWPFTGHCAYFERTQCEKWKSHCQNCPCKSQYPESYIDRSYKNFDDKRNAFLGMQNMVIITPSRWLMRLVKQSFLKDYDVRVIHNGINLDKFKPITGKPPIKGRFVLGVAGTWDERKGFKDFIKLRQKFSSDYQIVLVGLDKKKLNSLPNGITGISRTENVNELAKWYSSADVFVNPTYIDNFPTTNIEALACGTPVVTYNTGGSPEAIDSQTGRVVEKEDNQGLADVIDELNKTDKHKISRHCRKRAEECFDMNDRYNDYLELYKELLFYK